MSSRVSGRYSGRLSGRGRIIFLTGFSGTGKSHVGRLVSSMLGWDLADMDEMITQQAGAPIVEVFEQGEDHFRALERAVLAEVARGDRLVVSTGGGVPVSKENRQVMRSTGMTVRLDAAPELIYGRLKGSRRGNTGEEVRGVVRPMLQEEGDEAPVERIRALLAEREEAYATADATISTDELTARAVARRVVEAWKSFEGKRE